MKSCFIYHTVTDEDNGKKTEYILRHRMEMSGALISRLKTKDNGICVNGTRVFTNHIVKTGDMVSAEISDFKSTRQVAPIEYPLSILYEDEFIALIDKPAGMAVHGTASGVGGCTVENAAAFLWNDNTAFHAANRLDKSTSGIMTVAKNAYTHDLLRKSMHTSNYIRQYIAVTESAPSPADGTVDLSITKDGDEHWKRELDPNGISAITDYKTLYTDGELSIVKLKPVTGRTHQIRLHMSAIGCPLCGDELYGGHKEYIERAALHSYFIHLVHPVTNKTLEIYAPIPEDMKNIPINWGNL